MNKLLLLVLPAAIATASPSEHAIATLLKSREFQENASPTEASITVLLAIKARACRLNSKNKGDFHNCIGDSFADYGFASQLKLPGALVVSKEASTFDKEKDGATSEVHAIMKCVDFNRSEEKQKKCVNAKKFIALSLKEAEEVRVGENSTKTLQEAYNTLKEIFKANIKDI